jgi:hypothetical protein
MIEFGASMLKSCAGSRERRKLLGVQGSGFKVSGCGVFHFSSERLQPQPRVDIPDMYKSVNFGVICTNPSTLE